MTLNFLKLKSIFPKLFKRDENQLDHVQVFNSPQHSVPLHKRERVRLSFSYLYVEKRISSPCDIFVEEASNSPKQHQNNIVAAPWMVEEAIEIGKSFFNDRDIEFEPKQESSHCMECAVSFNYAVASRTARKYQNPKIKEIIDLNDKAHPKFSWMSKNFAYYGLREAKSGYGSYHGDDQSCSFVLPRFKASAFVQDMLRYLTDEGVQRNDIDTSVEENHELPDWVLSDKNFAGLHLNG